MAAGPGSTLFGASHNQMAADMTTAPPTSSSLQLPSSPSRRTSTLMEGLPKQFVASMRTLFDIMDDRKLGYVHLTDIESRWPDERLPLVRSEGESESAASNFSKPEGQIQQQQPLQQLPRGVIESLRKVTPPNGLLSFERFCAGLKICLLRNRNPEVGGNTYNRPLIGDGRHTHQQHHSHEPRHPYVRSSSIPSQSVPPIVARSHSTEAIQSSRHQPPLQPKVSPSYTNISSNTATVRPNVVLAPTKKITSTVMAPPLRTVSMPQLPASSSMNPRKPFLDGDPGPVQSLEQPRMPASGGGGHPTRRDDATASAHRSRNRRGIMTMLHHWHVGLLNDQQLQVGAGGNFGGANDGPDAGDDGTGVTTEHSSSKYNTQEYIGTAQGDETWKANRRTGSTTSRRREPRRHTLANGIDYNMLKRMKQMEQEKDVLMQGLEAVDKARAWYLRQIVQVQDKMKYIGHGSSHQEYSTEAHQERLNFEMAQIFEVNQNLSALVESSERGFPLHMNLAIRQRSPMPPSAATRSQSMDAASDYEQQERSLAELNRQLTLKSERITQLEMEKAALVRELFQARSHVKSAVSSGGREEHDISLM